MGKESPRGVLFVLLVAVASALAVVWLQRSPDGGPERPAPVATPAEEAVADEPVELEGADAALPDAGADAAPTAAPPQEP